MSQAAVKGAIPQSAGDHPDNHSQATVNSQPDASTERTSHGLRKLSQIFKNHGAQAFSRWTVAQGAAPELVATSAPLSASVRRTIEEMVASARGSGETQTRIQTSPDRIFAVVTPVPGIDGHVISVTFPVDELQSSDARRDQQLDVELAAAHISIDRMREALSNESASPLSTNTADITPNRLANQPEEKPPVAARATRGRWNPLESLSAKTWVALSTLLLAVVAAIPWPYNLKCDVVCEPVGRRFIAAPFDCKLLQSHVSPGEQVVADQVLATLDGSDLRAQLAGLKAEHDQAKQRQVAALSKGDASNAQLQRMEVTRLAREIEIISNQQHNLILRSPIQGVVVSGDLKRMQGSTLSVGETLLEIAPLDTLYAEIAIPKAEVSYARPDMIADVSLNALGGQFNSSQLLNIHPRSVLRDNQSVFIAEAPIENPDGLIRPGMRGTARIKTGQQPIGWILFHKPLRALRQWIGW